MNTDTKQTITATGLLNNWATPLIIVTFIVSAFTGLLIFFDLKTHPIKIIHEWGSVLFVVASLLHLLMHQRKMLSHLKKPIVWGSVISVTIIILLFAAFGPRGERHRQHAQNIELVDG